MQELDDNQLLAQYARHNSEGAYALLVERHLNLVYSVAMRHVTNPHQAEEITQVVFLILAKKAGSLSPQVILTGWLYRTARLTAANYLRMEKRRQNREQEAYMQSLAHESTPDVWTQIAPMLDVAMEHLSPKDRDAILLRFFEDKSIREVGNALRTSESATQKRVERALIKLRNFFTKRGVTLSVATLMGLLSTRSVHAAPAGLAGSTTTAALAKGVATSSGSTLLLMKSTMKIMTWLKIKTALVVGVSALLVAGTTTVTVAQIQQQDAAQAQPSDNAGNEPDSNSPQSATDFPSYLTKFKAAVDSHWHPKATREGASLNEGEVRVRYTISPSGIVTATVLDGSVGDLTNLMRISVQSIRETSPFLPFPPAMLKQYPDGYTNSLTFSTYHNTPTIILTPMRPEEAKQKGIAALVNHQAILWSRVYKDTEELETQLKQKMEGDKLNQRIANIRELVLIGLIKRLLAVDSFKAAGGTIPDTDVDQQIETLVKAMYHGDHDAFLKDLATQETTLERYKEGLANDAIIGLLQKQHEKDWNEWLDSLMAAATVQKFDDPNGHGFRPEPPEIAFPGSTTGITKHEEPIALTGYVLSPTGTAPTHKNVFLDTGSLNFAPTNSTPTNTP